MLTRKKSAAALSSPQIRRCNTESSEISKNKKLKVQKKDEIEPSKKSRRFGKKVPVDVPSPQIRKSRKRETETADQNKSKKLKTLKKGQKKHVKTYCWVCHKLAQGQTCTCGRVYHNECLEKTSKVISNNKCPECQLISVNGTELTRPFIDGLKVYLESATKLITEKHKKKMSWPQNSDVVPALDVETLIKKVQCNSYKTTAEFYADVKWFYHDCCVLYGEHSKHSKEIKKIVKEFKEELFDMEACPECYYDLYIRKPDDSDDENCEKDEHSCNEEFFVRLCNPPHDIVWAKVSGYSHFPAKCLKVINGKARVRFFGKHEKSDVPINTIFCISRDHPVYEYRNISNVETHTSLEYTYAKRELLDYITIYEKNVGDFEFFRFRSFYDPDNANSNTREKTREPELSVLTNASPTFISAPTEFETQVTTIPSSGNNTSTNMAFCTDTHTTESSALVSASGIQEIENTAGANLTFESPSLPVANSTASACMSPVSATGSSSSLPAYGMATLNGIQIKEEFLPTDFRQLVENTLMSSFFANGGSTASPQSCLASIIQNFTSHNNSEKTISPSILLPNASFIKKEFDDCVTSEVHQPERQIACISTDNPSTAGDQTPIEPQVVDLTGDDDSTPQPTLSNIFEKYPHVQQMFGRTHQVVGSMLNRLCAEILQLKPPEPNQMCEELTKKLDETEKKFREETEKLRDQIKHLEKNVVTENAVSFIIPK